jgi:hypothetical protein
MEVEVVGTRVIMRGEASRFHLKQLERGIERDLR